MSKKKSANAEVHHKNPFHGFLAPHCRALATVNKVSASPSGSLKKRKLPVIKHRGGKKNQLSIGHYVRTSCTLPAHKSLSNISSSPRSLHRWSSKLAWFEKEESMPSVNKTLDPKTLKNQARKVLTKIFSTHKSCSPSGRAILTTSQSSSSRSKSKTASEDALDTPKLTISYPMKLHNADISFVTTQDPWDSLVRSSSLSRRATLGTKHSEDRSSSLTERRLSNCHLTRASKRLSFSVHPHASHDPTRNPDPRRSISVDAETHRLPSSDRPNSTNHLRLSLDSKRSEGHPFPLNRGSLYRHPPTRPLSISHQTRRHSALALSDENPKRVTIDGGSRRSSIISSNLTSTTSQNRRSWVAGRTVLESATPQGSALTCSERSFVSTSGTEQKRVSSFCLPGNNWASVIEEDITLTLMGCAEDTNDIKKTSGVEIPTVPPPVDPSHSTPQITSISSLPSSSSSTPPQRSTSPIPPQPRTTSIPPHSSSSPTLPAIEACTPNTPLSSRLASREFHRPLTLLFKPNSSPVIEEFDDSVYPASDWYAELMNTVEESISKIT